MTDDFLDPSCALEGLRAVPTARPTRQVDPLDRHLSGALGYVTSLRSIVLQRTGVDLEDFDLYHGTRRAIGEAMIVRRTAR